MRGHGEREGFGGLEGVVGSALAVGFEGRRMGWVGAGGGEAAALMMGWDGEGVGGGVHWERTAQGWEVQW